MFLVVSQLFKSSLLLMASSSENLPSELASTVPQTITVTPEGNVAIQRMGIADAILDLKVMGQKFSHEGINRGKKHDEVDEDYMDEDDTNVEPMFDYHGFNEGFMSEADIGHMINMKKGGISVGQIYRALANQEGGYDGLKWLRDLVSKIRVRS
ncbi:hypothetical protein Ahy_A08g038040 isoform A [Arachis hypogaea]|uniref:Uncharacterized protein n=1 Tax=Arachis hypogaea TaxID=3818 RepID=A0A445BSF1_ARAHY|nr:hypothetical protein Ahy_A08g038040 isoform A [Arachis hypogaea]